MTDTTPDLDTLLQQLADKLGSAPSGSPGSAPDSPSPSGSPNGAAKDAADKALEFRKMFAEEMKYWEMIPPLDSETRRQIDLIMQQLPEYLKSLRDQPYLSSEANRSVALAVGGGIGSDERILPVTVTMLDLYVTVQAAKETVKEVLDAAGLRSERGEGMTESEQELLAVIQNMQEDLFEGERVPALLVIAVVGLGGTATGVAIGAAAKKAWNNLVD